MGGPRLSTRDHIHRLSARVTRAIRGRNNLTDSQLADFCLRTLEICEMQQVEIEELSSQLRSLESAADPHREL